MATTSSGRAPAGARDHGTGVDGDVAWSRGRERLDVAMPRDRLGSWFWTFVVTGIAAALRFHGLASPGGKIFDEIYYAYDSHNLLLHGVELNTEGNGPGFVVHPPMGKWLIAVGEKIFGYNDLGWRVSAAVIGSLSILVLVRVGRRMFRSTLLGCLAGILLSFDGLHFVQSRVSMLDIFLMWWVLAMFACLLVDRDRTRSRLARLADDADRRGTDLSDGVHRLRIRWWRILAAICGGLSLATKWDGIWYVLAFGVMTIAWDIGGWRSAGVRHPIRTALRSQAPRVFGAGVLAAGVYVASWTGWFRSGEGWDRHWAVQTNHHLRPIPDALVSLWHYHQQVLSFHTGLDTPHPYQSQPWSWLLLGRPVAYYYTSPHDCGAARCAREVLAIGNPVLWWPFLAALVAVAWLWLAHRDWRAAAVLVGVGAGILPWLPFPHRTMFLFYTLPALPFLVLATTVALAMVLEVCGVRIPLTTDGTHRAARLRTPGLRLTGTVVVGVYVLAVIGAFLYFYPLLAGISIPYDAWMHRIWLPTWI